MKRSALTILSAIILFSCAAPEKRIETVFFPPLPQNPKLQFLLSLTTEGDLGKKSSGFMKFLIGRVPDMKTISRPYDMGAVKGKIYILDRTYKKILILDLVKKEFGYIEDERYGALGDPAGIWVTEDDVKYVADMGRRQVVVFDGNNKFLRAYGNKDQFEKPVDVAVHNNRIYVCDIKRHMIIVVDKDTGETIQEIGGVKGKEGGMNRPTHVIVDHEGNIYVNDAFHFRIQKFDSEGNYLKTFGYQGDSLGGFARPKGIGVDKEGHLYVVDTAFENVQIFDGNTTDLLLFFGGFGPHPGSLYMPSGVYIDNYNAEYFDKYIDQDFKVKYLVYVGNMAGFKRLNVYGFGEWTGAPLKDR